MKKNPTLISRFVLFLYNSSSTCIYLFIYLITEKYLNQCVDEQCIKAVIHFLFDIIKSNLPHSLYRQYFEDVFIIFLYFKEKFHNLF